MLNRSDRNFAVAPVSHKVCFLRPPTTTTTSSSTVTSSPPSIPSSTISTSATFILSGSGATTTTLISSGTFNSEVANNTAHSASSVTHWTLLVSTKMSFLIATKAFLSFPGMRISIDLSPTAFTWSAKRLFTLSVPQDYAKTIQQERRTLIKAMKKA